MSFAELPVTFSAQSVSVAEPHVTFSAWYVSFAATVSVSSPEKPFQQFPAKKNDGAYCGDDACDKQQGPV